VASRDKKKPKRDLKGSNEDNNFCILNKTKYNSKIFSILHFIISKK
jgi:hypothetical protein